MFDPLERASFEAYYGPFSVDACADPEGHKERARREHRLRLAQLSFCPNGTTSRGGNSPRDSGF